ncbi:MAG: thioredoxin domain-containing protein [Myxococcota bacterium]
MARFDDAIARNVHKAKVDEDFAQFNAQGFRGTPTFTVGKDIVSGAQPIEPFLMAVARVKAGRDGQQLPRPTAAARAGGGRLVAIHWFGSFQDPATSRMLPVIQQVLEAYPEQVGVYWRDLPLPTLDRARPAARVVGAARGGMQAWNLLERLLLQRTRLRDADLVAHAKPLGIDESRVRKALAGDDAFVEKRIVGDIDIAKRFGAHAVPTLFINGVKLEGVQSFAAVKRVIEEALTPLR